MKPTAPISKLPPTQMKYVSRAVMVRRQKVGTLQAPKAAPTVFAADSGPTATPNRRDVLASAWPSTGTVAPMQALGIISATIASDVLIATNAAGEPPNDRYRNG